MLITDNKFYREEINTAIPELSDIGAVYTEKGLEAAEKRLADYVRAVATTTSKLPIIRAKTHGHTKMRTISPRAKE